MDYETILKRIQNAPTTFVTERGQLVTVSKNFYVRITDDSGTYDSSLQNATPQQVAHYLHDNL